MRWIVVADDLSGAAELGAAAVRFGYKVGLTRYQAPVPNRAVGACVPPDVDVWVIDTDSRDVDRAEALRRVRWAGSLMQEFDQARVFKKIDSVLRGHAGAEAESLAQMLGYEHILLSPGNPSRGRIVNEGQLLIDGVLLHETGFNNDPRYPALTSDVLELWKVGGARGSVAMEIVDVFKDVEAERQHGQQDRKGLPVGALDFFTAILEKEGRIGDANLWQSEAIKSVWVVCGSQAGWPERKRYFDKKGWPVSVVAGNNDVALTTEGCCLVGCGETLLEAPEVAVKRLATAVVERGKIGGPDLWCLEGGATAGAVMEAMGGGAFELVGEAAPGTAILRVMGARDLMMIKPGSYAWPNVVEKIWDRAAGFG